jgi:predicted glycogen debranching enzyme
VSQRRIDRLIRRLPAEVIASADDTKEGRGLLYREWLVTNGLGGYASGTVAGVATRRYHGMLVATLPNPLGRTMMLNHLTEHVRTADGTEARLGGWEYVGGRLDLPGARLLTEFRLEGGLPVWRFEVGGATIEKRIVLAHRQNTVYVLYHLVGGAGPVRLGLQPSVHFRSHDAPVDTPLQSGYSLSTADDHYCIAIGGDRAYPPLRLEVHGREPEFVLAERRIDELLYRIEAARGYQSSGALWTPGRFNVALDHGADAGLVASTEPREVMRALAPAEVLDVEYERRRRLLARAAVPTHDDVRAELVLAADQFLVTPVGRNTEVARARARGDEVRTVIAGYHWFTDWGRDTMISLEGLTLATGRHDEAGHILRTFARYVRDGLIPNMFPEGEQEGLYHTADATLWFFHALDRYLEVTGDRWTLHLLLPTLKEIVAQHLRGTRFGIGVDPADGLLRQGEEGYQLTWMDAKVDGWVVTPRRGKAVELNALWYNALTLLAGWLLTVPDEEPRARALCEHADRARESFNRRFWYEAGGHLYDVVDGPEGDDPACRPNQVFAISLKHPVLARARWAPVLETVRDRLLTPVGLRSLAPGHPDYKPNYKGDLRSRDAAYHQGTVWGWLVGPWIDAWLKLHPDDAAGARTAVASLTERLDAFGVGSLAEIFDAEAPYRPRGCIAQAWSVAEALRCWVKTAPRGGQAQVDRHVAP